MKWRTIKPGGQFLNLERLGTKTLLDTIESVTEGEYKGRATLNCRLKKAEMNVGLNNASCVLLDAAFGDDTDKWVGKKVKVKREPNVMKGGTPFMIVVSPLK